MLPAGDCRMDHFHCYTWAPKIQPSAVVLVFWKVLIHKVKKTSFITEMEAKEVGCFHCGDCILYGDLGILARSNSVWLLLLTAYINRLTKTQYLLSYSLCAHEMEFFRQASTSDSVDNNRNIQIFHLT